MSKQSSHAFSVLIILMDFWNCVEIKEKNYLILLPALDFCFNMYIQVNLDVSSTIVRKYLKQLWVAVAKGPHTSQWIKSKAWSDKWLELGKGNLLCFAIGQTTHSLFEWKKGTSDIQFWSFASKTCPNLRCHK